MLYAPLYAKTLTSPVGELHLAATDRGLSALEFTTGKVKKAQTLAAENGERHPLLQQAEKQLAEYFAGKRKRFEIRLDMRGTVFQLKAWQELQKIPYGETISYGEQARRVGDAKKARAVGVANGRNPVSIIVPCHRVIGASGALTGFGGGLPVKEYLLRLESGQS